MYRCFGTTYLQVSRSPKKKDGTDTFSRNVGKSQNIPQESRSYSMLLSPSLEADTCSASQEFSTCYAVLCSQVSATDY